jgi:hypothetical protein
MRDADTSFLCADINAESRELLVEVTGQEVDMRGYERGTPWLPGV